MKKDFKDIVAEVKAAYDIVDYIQSSGTSLKFIGGKYKGLCPFHNERTPSFTVDPNFQYYFCFGCQENGDLLSYVTKMESLDFFEALTKLAEDKDIKIGSIQGESSVDLKSLRECLREAANFFVNRYRELPLDHPARQEVRETRGLNEKRMLYGYAPAGKQTLAKHLVSKGFSEEIILSAGVCTKFENNKELFDFWSGRLMFFITDISGKPIGFSGRKLYEDDKRGKYVNSPDGPLFDKSAALFNIAKAKKPATVDKEVYVNEGQFDVAAMIESGSPNAVASSGTAFTQKQAQLLRRLVGENGKIVFCFDGDDAGRAAVVKVFKSAPSIHAQSYVVIFPESKDPCDYRLDNGNEGLLDFVKNSRIPLVEFVLNEEKAKYNMENDLEVAKYVAGAAQILATLAAEPLREQYARQVALDSFTSVETVNSTISDALKNVSKTKEVEVSPEEETKPVFEGEVAEISSRLVYLALAKKVPLGELETATTKMPPELQSVLSELSAMPTDAYIIPENFSNETLVAGLITSKFFPMEHLMTEDDFSRLAHYLSGRIETISRDQEAAAVRRRIMSKLGASSSLDARFLEKAIEKEQRTLQQEDRE